MVRKRRVKNSIRSKEAKIPGNTNHQTAESFSWEMTDVFNHVNIGFFSRDIKAEKYIRFTENCAKIYGYTTNDFFENTTLWFDLIHPDDKFLAEKEFEILEKGENSEATYRILHKDGSIRWIEVKALPIFENGQMVRVDGIVSDVTDRKNAEQQMLKAQQLSKIVLRTMPGMFYLFDSKGRYKYWNKQFSDVTGYSDEEIKVLDHAGFFQEEDREALTAKIANVFATGEDELEGTLVTKEGRRIPYFFTGKRVIVDDEVCVAGLGIDITERKKSEELLLKNEADLVQKNIGLREFSYIISHNLRAPVSKILGSASLIDIQQEADPVNRELVDYIVKEVTNLDCIVKDLNGILAVQNTDSKVLSSTSFNEILKLAGLDFQNEISETKTIITSNFEQAPEVKTLPAYLHSIFHNLISNAIKFRSPDRNLHLEIWSERQDNCVCLTVKDNGLGIDLERYGHKVFMLYNRFHFNNPIGKGVGLSLVKTQIEALGGRIELESAPNKGCTFRLYFPL